MIAEALKSVEWYDNHKLSTILACKRKAYFQTIFRGGLSGGVGDGANFGTCMHAARAIYYSLKNQGISEKDRRVSAVRKFAEAHEKFFGTGATTNQNKHSMANGLDLLDCYFDNWLVEDALWEPIETELAAVVPIEPRPGDPPRFSIPFYYVARFDGIWTRTMDKDFFVSEFKTTSGGVDREVTRRMIDRQTTGYSYVASQFPDIPRISGVFLDVMGVTTQKRDFRREVIMKSTTDLEMWRHQTINIVEDWRAMIERAKTEPELEVFYQTDGECTSYGLCPFWNGCYHGVTLLDEIPQNTWTPFNVE